MENNNPACEMLLDLNFETIKEFKQKYENRANLDSRDPWFEIVTDPMKCLKFLKDLTKNQKDIESNIKQSLKNKQDREELIIEEILESSEPTQIDSKLQILHQKLEKETNSAKQKKLKRKIEIYNGNKRFLTKKAHN